MKITLCGSARFEADFVDANRELTLMGHTVYSLAAYPSQHGDKDWYTEAQKVTLDLAHLSKIEESDGVVLVGYGYVGLSTAREVLWANMRGKWVMPLWPFLHETADRPFPHVDWDTVRDRVLVSNNWNHTLMARLEDILQSGEGENIKG